MDADVESRLLIREYSSLPLWINFPCIVSRTFQPRIDRVIIHEAITAVSWMFGCANLTWKYVKRMEVFFMKKRLLRQ